MKHVIRTMIVLLLSVSLAFSAAFPKGVISFKNGTQIRVKKVSIEENMVFYKYGGEERSNLLEDVEYIKARSNSPSTPIEKTDSFILHTDTFPFIVLGQAMLRLARYCDNARYGEIS